jgi:RNA polymerase sigma-70 factor (ECF subfamily)
MADPGASPISSRSDGDLARLVAEGGAAGDARDAEAELCRRFAPRIRLYGLKHLRTEERARDLVQSVLLVVIEALRARKIDDPALVDRFVLGTCRHVAQRIRHADGRAEPKPLADLDVAAVEPATETLDFPALLRCLARLDGRSQVVMQLSFFRERSADEIAAVLDTTAGNVRVVRHRAVVQLRHCLETPPEAAP